MVTLTKHEGLHLLKLGEDENRFTLAWLDAVEQALDAIESSPAPLITIGSGKFYSNGLDLDWVTAHMSELPAYTARIEALYARMLVLPVPTLAAVNGHAFGGGAMLALAHDWRVMREDRGYFCFPEVDIQIPFSPGMAALIQSKLTARQAIDAMTTGRRFGGPEAVGGGLADAVACADELLARAANTVADLSGKPAGTLRAIKETMYADVIGWLMQGSGELR